MQGKHKKIKLFKVSSGKYQLSTNTTHQILWLFHHSCMLYLANEESLGHLHLIASFFSIY